MSDLLVGDARDVLAGVAAGSVHCAVTSIPYWSLRVYEGVGGAVWGGSPDCAHEWGDVQGRPGNEHRNGLGANSEFAGRADKAAIRRSLEVGRRRSTTMPGSVVKQKPVKYEIGGGQWCGLCGAWRGCWGLEPDVETYTRNCVEFFRAVRRVLRDDGVLWLNLGDSYSGTGSGKGTGNFSQKDNPHALTPGGKRDPSLKPGDLCGMPWRVAFALQGFAVVPYAQFSQWADALRDAREAEDWGMVEMVERALRGWDALAGAREVGFTLRSAIVWAKGLSFCDAYSGSVMPESVAGTRYERCGKRTWDPKIDNDQLRRDRQNGRDFGKPTFEPCPGCSKCRDTGGWVKREGRGRPTSAYEMVFMLTPSRGYWYDAEAMRENGVFPAGTMAGKSSAQRATTQGVKSNPTHLVEYSGTRNVRNVYWLPLPDDPKALLGWSDLWVMGPEPLSLPHYAAFPRSLPRQCILATCPRYCCPACGKGWARVMDSHNGGTTGRSWHDHANDLNRGQRKDPGEHFETYARGRTLGWLPACSCYADDLAALFREHGDDAPAHAVKALPHVPGTVLDPCMGSGTTALAAMELSREWLGCEPSEEYAAMARKRVQEHDPNAKRPTVADVPPGCTLFYREEEHDAH